MHITELPAIVVEKILSLAVDSYGNKPYAWRHKLPYISICSAWRNMALRLVYRESYVEGLVKYGSTGSSSSSSSSIGSNDSDKSYETTAFSTNIDLITALGYTDYVRHLLICLDETRFIEPFVNLMPTLFGFGRHSWTRVQFLWLNLYQSILEDTLSYEEDVGGEGKRLIDLMGQMIVEEMPQVSMLRFDSDGEPAELSRAIKTALLDNYAHRLRYYSTGYPVAHSFERFSSELAHLEIRINRDSAPLLPRINAACLKKLVLDDVPSQFSWQCFEQQPSDNPRELIRFNNLRVLELYFTGQLESDPADHRRQLAPPSAMQYTVEFPRLHSLSVTNYPPDAAMSLVAEYPVHMKQLTLRYSFVPPSVFIKSRIRTIESLDITLYYAQLERSDEFYALTNHLFGRAVDVKRQSALLMSYSEFQLDLGRTLWPNLTVVRLMSQVDYATMEQLVRSMPRLEKMVIYELVFSQRPVVAASAPGGGNSGGGQLLADAFVSDDQRITGCALMWETAIGYLDILSLAYVSRPDIVASCIKRFLLHVPSLRSLHINGCEAIGLRDFVDLVKPQYPHLHKLMLSG